MLRAAGPRPALPPSLHPCYNEPRTDGASVFFMFATARLGNEMAKKETRVMIVLACQHCKRRNYNTQKNKQHNTDRLELSKYCRFCRCARAHRETR